MNTGPIITPTLRTIQGATPAALYELGRAATVLGKAPECDIVLDRNTVSKRHALIECRPDGYYLVDLESRNKTYLDGRVVDRPMRLRDGGVIRVCSFLFAFCQPAVADGDRTTILGVIDAPGHDAAEAAAGVRPEEKLRALMAINRELAGTLGLRDVLAGVLKTLFRVFPQADRGFVLLGREGGGDLTPSAIESRHGDPGHLTISRTVFDHVMRHGRAVLSADAPAEFGAPVSLVNAGVCTLMAVPLRDRRGRPAGVLQLDTRDRRGRFEADDLDLLAAVAGQVGVAVENARLRAVELRQHALDQEARDARDVQLALLPARRPSLDGYEFWDGYEPARSVGGDYYDYVPLDPAATRWAVAVGDVEGKGMPAALYVARLSAEVRSLVRTEPDPTLVVSRLNQALCDSGGDKFVTFLLTVVDGPGHRLTAVSAGHMGPLVRRAGGRVEVIGEEAGGLVLGVEGGQTYRAAEATLGPGDVVVLYTDGVSEATDRGGRQFGAARLSAALASAPGGANAAGEAILREVRRHTADCPQGDDITLLCFGRL